MTANDEQVQIVAVLPGGGFESLGLVELQNLDAVLACLATLDTRGGHAVSLIDLKAAYQRAKDAHVGIARHRQTYGTDPNNDADDDCA